MYIDGFLIPVPTARKDEYRAHEEKWWPAFRDLGATGLMVAWGDDIPDGRWTDFRRAVDARDDETPVLCWMTWPDRATRDAAHQAFMERADIDPSMMDMPFDGKRLVMGGFAPIFQGGAA